MTVLDFFKLCVKYDCESYEIMVGGGLGDIGTVPLKEYDITKCNEREEVYLCND